MFADGACQTDVFTQDIFVNDEVTATVTPTATSCGNNNGSIIVSGETGGNGTYEYSLDRNNWQSSNSFNGLTSGDYNVFVRTSGNACDTIYTVNLGPSSAFNASAQPGSAICLGESTDISASGGNTYQ